MTIPKTILVPVDLSERASAGVAYAGELAKHFGADLVLTVNVNAPERAELEMIAIDIDGTVEDAAQITLKEMAELHAPGVEVLTDVRHRDFPAEGIHDAIVSHSIDLVVITSHGRGGALRWLLGSVAEKIVRTSPVPVLVVPVRGDS